MNSLVIVPAQLLLLFLAPRPQGNFQIPLLVLAAHHEPDLAGRVRGDGSVSVFDIRKDFQASSLEVRDELKV